MKGIAVVSGGLDSVVLSYYLKRAQKHDLEIIAFDYGQRHYKETAFAHMCADDLKCPFDVVDISDVGKRLTGSSLTDEGIEVPDGHYADRTMRATVVPNRNAIFLSIAFGIAISKRCRFVAIANHAGDHFIYPDCRVDFIQAFSHMERQAMGELWNVELFAPFSVMSKSEIVNLGRGLGVPFNHTWSCYKGGRVHCGTCGTCNERKEAFQLARVPDPTLYLVA